LSTQEPSTEDFPPLELEGEDLEQEQYVLTPVNNFGRVSVSFASTDNHYTPQCDNPSTMLPGDPDDVDVALEAFLASQKHTGEEEKQNEFSLDIQDDDDASSVEAEENTNNGNLPPSYTQLKYS